MLSGLEEIFSHDKLYKFTTHTVLQSSISFSNVINSKDYMKPSCIERQLNIMNQKMFSVFTTFADNIEVFARIQDLVSHPL